MSAIQRILVYDQEYVVLVGIRETLDEPKFLQIYSSSYEGEICFIDLEKENFNMIQLCDYPVFSLCQAPNNASCLYFGEGNDLKLFDERMGKVSNTWNLHDNRINSIDFHPENTYMLATSSADKTACIWDMRTMKKEAESLKVFEHNKSVHSAYFSPSGLMVATTREERCYPINKTWRKGCCVKHGKRRGSYTKTIHMFVFCLIAHPKFLCHKQFKSNFNLDDTVRIFSLDNFDKSHIVKHYNQTGRWLSKFKAIWGWNDTDLFIGNMKRAIDIISVELSDSSLSASNSACLESEHMTTIPCRFCAHPYKVGHLACSSTGGKVFVWTRA